MRPFKKYATCIMAFFTPFNFVNIQPALTLPLRYSLNFTKKLQNERKEDFWSIWLLQRITLYKRR